MVSCVVQASSAWAGQVPQTTGMADTTCGGALWSLTGFLETQPDAPQKGIIRELVP